MTAQLMVKPISVDTDQFSGMAVVWSWVLEDVPTQELRRLFQITILSRRNVSQPITAPEMLQTWVMKKRGMKFCGGEWIDDPRASKPRY